MVEMGTRKFLAGGIACLCLCAAGTAFAQDADEADHIAALKACQQIAADTERLTCLDAAAGAFVAASEQGDVRLVDADDVRQTRRRLFGFTLPDLNIFGGNDDEDDELDMLESTITSVRYSAGDAFVFEIAEGDALWQVRNAPARLRQVEVGDPVVFKRAALGSYFIRIDGQIGVKGKRIE
ncbi:hypothetical protein [Pelagerythrobacter sp.]|uniref:hypothetical protein n=1 Tax=Pelagerythrobacter sp. TaxID=2800702 RepID=UPI0035B28CBC